MVLTLDKTLYVPEEAQVLERVWTKLDGMQPKLRRRRGAGFRGLGL